MRQVTVIGPQGRTIRRGRVVVDPDGVRTWETKVKESRHLFRSMDAWTISETILQQLKDLRVGRIRFIVMDKGGEIYEVALEKFLDLAEELDQAGWKMRTERQYALPRRCWERRESAQLALQL